MIVFAKEIDHSGKDTYLVSRLRGGKRAGQQVRIGAPDKSLTAVSGMVAVTEGGAEGNRTHEPPCDAALAR
jgi:hypothetical protein